MNSNIYYNYILFMIMLKVTSLPEDAKSCAWIWFRFRFSGLCP